MVRRALVWWGLVVFSLLLPSDAAAQALSAKIRFLPEDFVALDDEVVLEIKISTARDLDVSEPKFRLKNLEILSGPKKNVSLRIVDGELASNRTLTWKLKPRRTGTARVYSASFEVEGRRVALPVREIEVLDELPRESFSNDSSSPWSRRSTRRRDRSAPEVFLRAEVSTANPWVGEQIVYRVYLYTQVDIGSVNPEDMPGFKGFWVRVIPQPDDLKPQMVDVDGKRYGKAILLERALFARRPGKLRIEPVTARMRADLQSGSVRRSGRIREISRTSNEVVLDVRPLPTPPEAPDGGAFRGAIGRLQWTADLEPKKLAVGEAATLRLILRGEGHLQGIAAPDLPRLEDLEIFPPQPAGEEEIVDKVLRTTRTWSFVVVPKRAGEHVLPAIERTVFDPHRGAYETLSTLPLKLQVEGVAALGGGDGAALLHPIRSAALPAPPVEERSSISWWWLLAPWPLALVFVLWRGRRDADSDDPRQEFLQALEAAAQGNSPRSVAVGIEDAWKDFLEKRWEVPRSVAAGDWREELIERGAKERFAEDLNGLAEDLHYLRYAPKLSSTDDLREEILERSRELATKF